MYTKSNNCVQIVPFHPNSSRIKRGLKGQFDEVFKPEPLALFGPEPQEEKAVRPAWRVSEVPIELAIAPNRYHVSIYLVDQVWPLPIQFHRHEVDTLLPSLEGFSLRLDADGKPESLGAILKLLERAIDSEWVGRSG